MTRFGVTVAALLVAALVALAVWASTSEAHTLTQAGAARVAHRYAQDLARLTRPRADRVRTLAPCHRRTRHRVDCTVQFFFHGSHTVVCEAVVAVRFTNSSRRVSRRLVGPGACV